MVYDMIIVGGGIVGLAIALAVKTRDPDCKLAVLEKESGWAKHQSSRNSGVIHAGIYYHPGSKKATFAASGNPSMYAFCEAHDIPVQRTGKLIVATSPDQLPALDLLNQRAAANGVEVFALDGAAAQEREPHVNCLQALHLPATGVVDFKQVAAKYVELLSAAGVDLILNCEVTALKHHGWGYSISSSQEGYQTRYLISSAGLYADRLALMAGVDPGMRIIPFRGEYWSLARERRSLVKSLIYPVPDPKFPFLGVHLTRLLDGSVHAGPNAVLAFSREGYSWNTIQGRDLMETITYPGFIKLAHTYFREGLQEIRRSLMKSAFVTSVKELIPEVNAEDLVQMKSGVRAQAVRKDGGMMDDFHVLEQSHAMFILNAPSPAATASLEIGKFVADRLYGEQII